MKIPYISQSRINLYRECPYSYYLRYSYEGEPFARPHIVPLENGNAVHRTIEDALIRYKSTDEWDADFVVKSYVKYATKAGINQDVVKEMSKQLRTWAKSYVPPPKIVGIEQRHEVSIDGIPIVAIMDMVEIDDQDNLVIHDWKSNIQPYNQEKLESDIQAPLYLKLAKLLYPDQKGYKFKFEFVRNNITIEYEYEEEDLDFNWLYIKSMYDVIKEDEKPESRPCYNCATCPGVVHDVCPMVKAVREHGLDYCLESLEKSLRRGESFADDSEVAKLLAEKKSIKGMEDILKAMKTTTNKKLLNLLDSKDLTSDIVAGHKISMVSRVDTKYNPITVWMALEKDELKLAKALDVRKGIVDGYIKDGSIGKKMGQEIIDTASRRSSAPYIMVKKTSKGEKEQVGDDDGW